MKRDTKLIAFVFPTDHEFLLCLVVDNAQKIYLILKYKIHVEFHSFYYEWIIYCIEVH